MKTIFIIVSLLLTSSLFAQWTSNTNENTPIITGQNVTFAHQMVNDGNGGLFIPFQKKRNGRGSYDIYVQHINSAGVKLWSGLGILLSGSQPVLTNVFPHIISDAQGGAIIMWQYSDSTTTESGKVLIQRINSSGQLLWNPSGIIISSLSGVQSTVSDLPRLFSDNKGGAFAIFDSHNQGSTLSDFVIQRINPSGNLLFGNNGIYPYSQPTHRSSLAGNVDSTGGLVLSWQSQEPGDSGYVYVQKVDSSGNLWTPNGIKAAYSIDGTSYDHPFTDLHGGVYVVYTNNYEGVFLQRVNSLGQRIFPFHGIMLHPANTDAEFPHGIVDKDGNAIIIYTASTNHVYRIYIHKISLTGELLFGPIGKRICTTELDQQSPLNIVSDGNDGYVIPFSMNNGSNSSFWDIYGQRINSNGDLLWGGNGTALCTAQWYQTNPFVLMLPNQKFVFSWNDQRFGPTTGDLNIYLQRANADGTVGIKPVSTEIPNEYFLFQNFPNPFNPSTTIKFNIPVEGSGLVRLLVFDALGREVKELVNENLNESQYSVALDMSNFGSGVYFYTLETKNFKASKRFVLLK